ncbi:sensor histidine kinase [Beduini massiliensis]|uniref:sensor histidine kinase n=1 Tax=Beduini massiliensis TaxID=1585974 RepID=UPI000694B3AF|nr:HAMP domain-containing sensor histidine kinase [Beduini massiliensis]
MSKVTIKMALVVSVFALFITSLFVLGIFSFASIKDNIDIDYYIQENMVERENYATIDDISELVEPDESSIYENNDGRYADLKEYTVYYNAELMKRIIPIAGLFCIFLIGASILMWILLKRIQHQENKRIANQLASLQEIHEFTHDDPVLAKAYESIQREFDRHITDYKRLHTYLSHEQKNALSLLKANLELHHEEACMKNIDDINEGIDDLVTLSEQGKETDIETVDITLLCADVYDKYKVYYPQLNFQFDDQELLVKAKPRWIICALNNLIDNAIKYGNNKEILLSVYRKNDQAIIEVKDHGIGIAKDKLEKIFDHHYRINELNKDGYGIGLSLLQHVCELCDGMIECSSVENEGTVFTLAFPINN